MTFPKSLATLQAKGLTQLWINKLTEEGHG